jgi:hypothetical protein
MTLLGSKMIVDFGKLFSEQIGGKFIIAHCSAAGRHPSSCHIGCW